MNGHLQLPSPVPSAQVPSLPVGFDEVIATAMAKAPQERFQSCAALSSAAAWALSTDSADASARTQTTVIPYQPWPRPTPPQSTVPQGARPTERAVTEHGAGDYAMAARVCPAGHHGRSSSLDGTVRLWDVASGAARAPH